MPQRSKYPMLSSALGLYLVSAIRTESRSEAAVNLYSEAIDAVTYGDVDAFLQEQYAENNILDYKKEVTSELTKLICAFANTDGGIALSGFTVSVAIWFFRSFIRLFRFHCDDHEGWFIIIDFFSLREQIGVFRSNFYYGKITNGP